MNIGLNLFKSKDILFLCCLVRYALIGSYYRNNFLPKTAHRHITCGGVRVTPPNCHQSPGFTGLTASPLPLPTGGISTLSHPHQQPIQTTPQYFVSKQAQLHLSAAAASLSLHSLLFCALPSAVSISAVLQHLFFFFLLSSFIHPLTTHYCPIALSSRLH